MSNRRMLRRGGLPPEFNDRSVGREVLRKGRLHESSLGREVTIEAPDAAGLPSAITQRTERRILIDCDLTQLMTPEEMVESPGSWVVTLTATAQGDNRPLRVIFPVVAYWEFGTGGIITQFETDVARTVVAVPSSTLRISLGWDQLDAATAAVLDTARRLPESVTVRATVHRSNAAVPAATRTYINCFDPTVGPGAQTVTLPIPNFAKAWRLAMWSFARPQLSAMNYEFTVRAVGSLAGTILDGDDDSARIERFSTNLCARYLPPAAKSLFWRATGPSASPEIPEQNIIYDLDF